MKRIFDRVTILSTLATLSPIAVAPFLYHRLPERMAIHFNAQGTADGWASRPVALFGLPLLMALTNIVVQFMVMTDPKRNLHSRAFRLARYSVVPISILVQVAIVSVGLGIPIEVARIIPLGVALLYLVIGNYLPTCTQSYTVGIRLPWTLASEENWAKTHRLAGWVWTTSSLLLIIALLAGIKPFPLFLIVTAVIVIIPVIYSYLLYRKAGDLPTDTV